MSMDRLKRVNELLRREIGASLYHVLKPSEVDLAAITVTRVSASRNLRTARVMVSVRDHVNERDRIMHRIRRHRVEIQGLINKNLQLKYTPRLIFEFDPSIEKGDHVLDILRHIEEGSDDG